MKHETENTAYWTQKTHFLRADEFICSACTKSSDKAYKNCPSCGALMTKNKYEASWVDEAEILDIIFGD